MQLDGLEESDNVEDRRGNGAAIGASVGGGGLIILVLALVFGVNPQQIAPLIQKHQAVQNQGNGKIQDTPEEAQKVHLVKVVLKSTEQVWTEIFQRNGKKYTFPELVIFRGVTPTACGQGEKAMGPFYCPGDKTVYIDLGFYDEMEKRLNIPGDFPRCYVIAHEVGHHVQNLLGWTQKADQARGTSKENQMSVRLELQADYLAGVWAFYAKDKFHLNPDDIAKAINAAKQIGDDTLQRNATGTVRPEKFTHGTSAQRQRWFRRGFETGDFKGMDKLFTTDYSDL